MKRKSILFTLALAVLMTVFTVTTVEAAEIRTKETTVEIGEVVSDDLYMAGEEISVDGTVEGDVLVTGGIVDISGDINGDLYISGGTVNLGGVVSGNAYVAAGMLNFTGHVGGNFVYAAGQFNGFDTSVVSADLVGASGMATVSSTVGDDLRLAAGMIRVDGDVSGDAITTGGDIEVNEDLVLGDTRIFDEASDVNVDTKVDIDPAVFKGVANGLYGFGLVVGFFMMVGRYLTGLLLFKVAPVKTESIVEKTTASWEEFFKSLGIGALVTFGMPVIAIVLLFTLVGTPIALLVLGLMLFVGMFGSLWIELAIGRVVLKQFKSKNMSTPLALLVGMLISFVKMIPLIGGLYKLALTWTSFGAFTRMKMDMWDMAKKKGGKK